LLSASVYAHGERKTESRMRARAASTSAKETSISRDGAVGEGAGSVIRASE
jgi:hypothetical protein